jgi:hypothetical protein
MIDGEEVSTVGLKPLRRFWHSALGFWLGVRQLGNIVDSAAASSVWLPAVPIQAVCLDYFIPAKLFNEDRKPIRRELQVAETEFRAALQKRPNRLQWRSCTTMSPLADHRTSESRHCRKR